MRHIKSFEDFLNETVKPKPYKKIEDDQSVELWDGTNLTPAEPETVQIRASAISTNSHSPIGTKIDHHVTDYRPSDTDLIVQYPQ